MGFFYVLLRLQRYNFFLSGASGRVFFFQKIRQIRNASLIQGARRNSGKVQMEGVARGTTRESKSCKEKRGLEMTALGKIKDAVFACHTGVRKGDKAPP